MSARVQVTRAAAMMGLLVPSFIMAASSTIRSRVANFIGWKATGATWRTLVILLMFLNLKNLPLVWHFRVFRGIIYQIWFQPTDFPAKSLFKFMVTTSHSPLWETDYNLHKSNSTYFSDLDVARTHLVSAMLRRGIRGVGSRPGEEATSWNISTAIRHIDKKPVPDTINPLGVSGVETVGAKDAPLPRLGREMTEEEFVTAAKKPGNLLIALGSVACFFHKEIPPYRRYEIWTRLLTWDKKWLYFVSYFVEVGAIQPDEFVLQPQWKPKKQRKARPEETLEDKTKRLRGKIYATSIATYVVKKGRLTIPPEVVLQRSSLLPEKPPDAPSLFYTPPDLSTATTPRNDSGNGSPVGSMPTHSQVETSSLADSEATILDEVYYPGSFVKGDDEWTWDIVEKERQRGLRFAKTFDSMNSMRENFEVEQKSALGNFPDLLAFRHIEDYILESGLWRA